VDCSSLQEGGDSSIKRIGKMQATLVLSVLFGLIGGSEASARSVLYCSSSGSGCFYSRMPLYSQNSNSLSDLFPSGDPNKSMLCAPTSASMALGAIVDDGLSFYSSSWTGEKFAWKSQERRIRNFVKEMDTDVNDGTTGAGEKFKKRQADIYRASGNVDSASFTTIDDGRIKELIDRHEVNILSRGVYDRSCSGSLSGSSYSCTYRRKSGHVLAVNGSLVENGVRKTRLYDPWYTQVKNVDLVKVADHSFTTVLGIRIELDPRPFNGKTRQLDSASGNSFKIVEELGGINTND
jgi:hypothetical protein